MSLSEDWLKEEHGDIETELGEVLTSKEIEKLYNVPINTVVQDIRRGRMRLGTYRKSMNTWLITRQEANRMYSEYAIRQERRGQKKA